LTTLYLASAKKTGSWCARKGDLQHASSLDVLMVPSSKLSFIANDNNPTDVGLAPGSTIHFSSLDLGAMFVGMLHSGSPSQHSPLRSPLMRMAPHLVLRGAWDPPTPVDATWFPRWTPPSPHRSERALRPYKPSRRSQCKWRHPSQEWSPSHINSKPTKRSNKC
jgi:hypothetical protein